MSLIPYVNIIPAASICQENVAGKAANPAFDGDVLKSARKSDKIYTDKLIRLQLQRGKRDDIQRFQGPEAFQTGLRRDASAHDRKCD